MDRMITSWPIATGDEADFLSSDPARIITLNRSIVSGQADTFHADGMALFKVNRLLSNYNESIARGGIDQTQLWETYINALKEIRIEELNVRKEEEKTKQMEISANKALEDNDNQRRKELEERIKKLSDRITSFSLPAILGSLGTGGAASGITAAALLSAPPVALAAGAVGLGLAVPSMGAGMCGIAFAIKERNELLKEYHLLTAAYLARQSARQ